MGSQMNAMVQHLNFQRERPLARSPRECTLIESHLQPQLSQTIVRRHVEQHTIHPSKQKEGLILYPLASHLQTLQQKAPLWKRRCRAGAMCD